MLKTLKRLLAGRATLAAGNADAAEVHYRTGLAAWEAGQLEAAEKAFLNALEKDPEFARAATNLGCLAEARGDLQGAERSYRRAATSDPELAAAAYNLGNVLRRQGRMEEAEGPLRRAVRLEPGHPDWHCNLGGVLFDQCRVSEAVECCRAALGTDEGFARGHADLGWMLAVQGEQAAAEKHMRRALALDPRMSDAHSTLLLILHYLYGDEPEFMRDEHFAWANLHARAFYPEARSRPADGPTHGRFRIAYLSPDLRRHSVAWFLEPLLACHDRGAFEVRCYSDVAKPDEITARLQGLADAWDDVTGLSDDALAQKVRNDGVDILVDLAGHSSGNRIGVFARAPAPLQITYLGYPNTTGLATMDYRITDHVADPPGSERWHSEALLRLPRPFLCYSPPQDAPEVAPAPGVRSGRVTFGCFNSLAKITPAVLHAWGDILRQVPGSRLVLKSYGLADEGPRARVARELVALGISPDRLEILGPMSSTQEHLAAYGKIDIALDVFPYNGTTTTCEALWMGVPVVTIAGTAHVARVGASLLHGIGATEWVAEDPSGYVEQSRRLAADAGGLAEIRSGLRERVQRSELCDAKSFAQAMEAGYRRAWDSACGAACAGDQETE